MTALVNKRHSSSLRRSPVLPRYQTSQRHRLLIEHRLDRLARCLDVEAVLFDQIPAIGQDGVGVLQHLQPFEMIVMVQPHAGADDFQKIHDAEWPIALVRAQFAMIGMIDRD